MNKLYDFYCAFVSPGNLGKNYSIPAQHAQVGPLPLSHFSSHFKHCCLTILQLTNDYGDRCDVSKSPYIDNCDYPSAFVLLQYIYGDIQYADTSKMIPANVNPIITGSLLLSNNSLSLSLVAGI